MRCLLEEAQLFFVFFLKISVKSELESKDKKVKQLLPLHKTSDQDSTY